MRPLLLTLFIMLGGISAQSQDKIPFNEIKKKSCSELSSSKGNAVLYQVPLPKGFVIVAHGLNNKPEIMGDDKTEGTLIYNFLKEKFSVLRIELYGHGKNQKEMEETSQDDWKNSAYLQYCFAYEQKRKLPFYFIGFSLGALVFEELMNEKTATPVHFDKAVLFAPAISINSFTRTINWLSIFSSKHKLIPSAAPQSYRAHPGTSLNAYQALFELEDALEASQFEQNNTPTLIFIHPDDEVVDYSKLKRRVEKFKLKKWMIREVSTKDSRLRPKYHHLIIDKRALGEKEWLRVNDEMMTFIKSF